MEPTLEIALWIFFLVVAVCSVGTALYRWKNPTRRAMLPLVICSAAAIIALFVPFDRIYLAANFRLFEARRTAVAKEALAGKLGVVRDGGRGDLVKLPAADHLLSDDGEIVVEQRDGRYFVLFFTFRGILDRFSGFVYSPTDTPPAKDEFLGDGQEIERLAPNWYWYAS